VRRACPRGAWVTSRYRETPFDSVGWDGIGVGEALPDGGGHEMSSARGGGSWYECEVGGEGTGLERTSIVDECCAALSVHLSIYLSHTPSIEMEDLLLGR
jgi:hypothetical protein